MSSPEFQLVVFFFFFFATRKSQCEKLLKLSMPTEEHTPGMGQQSDQYNPTTSVSISFSFTPTQRLRRGRRELPRPVHNIAIKTVLSLFIYWTSFHNTLLKCLCRFSFLHRNHNNVVPLLSIERDRGEWMNGLWVSTEALHHWPLPVFSSHLHGSFSNILPLFPALHCTALSFPRN